MPKRSPASRDTFANMLKRPETTSTAMFQLPLNHQRRGVLVRAAAGVEPAAGDGRRTMSYLPLANHWDVAMGTVTALHCTALHRAAGGGRPAAGTARRAACGQYIRPRGREVRAHCACATHYAATPESFLR
ncbi:hypothetical protein RR46_01386 [Papilio xuthus]|uniref:Uncharacterized protein n=1 Tax=Papilio xuthus TaxID=66420 RepID=A0A0N1IB75_PAPXU|nr:hypothetical protein RR46_01386 [Papilio xuthus]